MRQKDRETERETGELERGRGGRQRESVRVVEEREAGGCVREGEAQRERARGVRERAGGVGGGALSTQKSQHQPLKVIPSLTARGSRVLCFQRLIWEHFAAQLTACLPLS